MRTTLLLCLLSVSFGVASLSLVIVHSILQKQIHRDLVADLQRSIITFQNIQTQQQQILSREAALVAALPYLKSLMTTSDAQTIRDGAAGFFTLSGGDLFVLADPRGAAIALFEKGTAPGSTDPQSLVSPSVFGSPEQRYLLLRGHLFVIASQPLYFGSELGGTKLGYVLLGYAVNRQAAQEVSQVASAQVSFYANGARVATTLNEQVAEPVTTRTRALLDSGLGGQDIRLGREHYVGDSATLSGPADPEVQLVVLKSYDQASQYLTQLNQALFALGAFLLVLSGLLALYLATTITRPLDRLVAGARALGAGDFDYKLRSGGAREIRELGDAFDRMRRRLRETRQELVAAERLATIGRMASSISHDLRHYLSAVYANAEFLGYDSGGQERMELLAEIRQGVRGMTDLIDSLLLFSRTGQSLQLSWESLPFIVERSMAMVRAHPDAQSVAFTVDPMPPVEVWMDTLKIERALYNLFLNGCQAARQAQDVPQIHITLTEDAEWIRLSVTDNGPGVPESIRVALFQPFVSEGKASGIGLGLALAHKIAQEHGGGVTLEESRSGRTVFTLALAQAKLREFGASAHPSEAPTAVK